MRFPLVLSCLVLLLGGCSQTSFVGRQVDDFTAYYNKFYNAERVFAEEMRKLDEETQPVDHDEYLAVFPRPERMRGSQQQLEATVTKSAEVLRQHPSSRWVDDALLLIGKAYFFQQNFAAAEQKFREVIGMGTGLVDESRLWLARSLAARGDHQGAIDHVETSLQTDEAADERWARRLHLVLGELFVRSAQWERAAAELETGLDGLGDHDLAARAQFVLGQVYETLGRFDDAAAAYLAVESRHPVFEISYAAKVGAIRVIGQHGDAEVALDMLRRMDRDDKYYEYRGELAYLRGRIYQQQGFIDDAHNVYHDMLYRSDADISNVRGAIHYALGELYRDGYRDFIGAAAHFDTAATALASRRSGASEEDMQLTPAAVVGSREVADVFASYADVSRRVQEADSLLRLSRLSDEEFDAFVMDLRRAKAEELEAERARQERARNQRRFQQPGAQMNVDGRSSGGTADVAAEDLTEAGFLFHRNAMRVREGKLHFVERWGQRPHVPNWRRVEAVTAAREEEGEEVDTPLDDLEAAGPVLPEVDVSAVPRDSSSRAELQAHRAMVRYELGNVLFIQMNRPDSAIAWYRRVMDEDAEQPVARRALYALAEVQRALGDTVAADRLYRDLVDRYPQSELADRVREYLGMHPSESAVSDTFALADEAYAQAYDYWRQGDLQTALPAMVEVAARFSATPAAPRALLAAGSITLEWARRDSLDLSGRVPAVLSDSLLRRADLLTFADVPAGSDSTAATPASALAVHDSISADASTDRLETDPADSLEHAVDTERTAADSLTTESRTVASSDSMSTETPDAQVLEPSVHIFYAAIDERYPETPQADRARSMIEVLRELEAEHHAEEALPDTAQVSADTSDSSVSDPDVVEGRASKHSGDNVLRSDSTDIGVSADSVQASLGRRRAVQEDRSQQPASPAVQEIAPPARADTSRVRR